MTPHEIAEWHADMVRRHPGKTMITATLHKDGRHLGDVSFMMPAWLASPERDDFLRAFHTALSLHANEPTANESPVFSVMPAKDHGGW